VREILDGVEDVHFANLTSSDVVRHRLVGDIVDAYERWDAAHQQSGGARPAVPARPAGRAARGAERRARRGRQRVRDRRRRGALAGICTYVLAEMGVNPMAELSVLCVDADYMSTLHERWMGEKGPDRRPRLPHGRAGHRPVPTSPDPGPALLGDVVLCPSVAVRQARAAGHTMDDELSCWPPTACCTSSGYDHMEPEEEKEMFGLQPKLLDGLARRARGSRDRRGRGRGAGHR
jgi:probable rRNA maturation factor